MPDFLLDTSVILWELNEDSRLTRKAKEIILFKENRLITLVSCFWEIAIKANLGKLNFGTETIKEFLMKAEKTGMIIKEILPEALDSLLKLSNYHKDPFDRLLVAHSIVLDIPIISSDSQLDAYGIQRIWN